MKNHLVLLEGDEWREVVGLRPQGDKRVIGAADLLENVARNFSRQPAQESATAFMERAHKVNRAASRTLQSGFGPADQGAVEGEEPMTWTATSQHRSTFAKLTEIAAVTKEAMTVQNSWLADLAHASLKMVLPAICHAIDAFVQHPDHVARREALAEPRNNWVKW